MLMISEIEIVYRISSIARDNAISTKIVVELCQRIFQAHLSSCGIQNISRRRDIRPNLKRIKLRYGRCSNKEGNSQVYKHLQKS